LIRGCLAGEQYVRAQDHRRSCWTMRRFTSQGTCVTKCRRHARRGRSRPDSLTWSRGAADRGEP
jgi:hypothetical protein